MKTLRFVLILSFIFTFAVHPVQAQAGERYGFVPLVTEADPNMPLQVQAQQAFERLLPQLNAAKRSGDILEFEPEFSAGILKIRYAASTGMTASAFTTAQEFDDIQAAVAQVPEHQRTVAGADGINSAGLVPNFMLEVYGSCFSGYGIANDSKVSASLYDKTGKLVSNSSSKVYSNNRMYGCFAWSGILGDIQPGYKAIYKIYRPIDGTLLRTLTTTIPSITLDNTNRAGNVVTGTGPANKAYHLFWGHNDLNDEKTYTISSVSGTISAQRNFLADFSIYGKTPLRGRDTLEVQIIQNVNFSFYLNTNVRSASCELDTNYCYIIALPYELVSAKIVHAGIPYLFTERASSSGYVYFDLEDAQKNPFMAVPGDKLESTGMPAHILPKITANVDFAKNKIQGVIPANSYFDIWTMDSFNYGWQWAHAKPTTAYYSIDFTSIFDFNPENGLRASIKYIDPKTGHTTTRDFVFGQ